MNDSTTGAQFTVGEWTVEPNLGRIQRNGESTVIEPRVMELLVFLASRAGETVSTDDLASEVWSGRAITDQPVYQGIAQLRKALDDSARRPRYIQTVTKKGYRLIAPVGIPVSGNLPVSQHSRVERQPAFLAPVLSLIVAASFLFFSSSDVSVSRERPLTSPIGFASIAVLPFVDMSEDQSQQYLGDGIAEELIHRIAAVPDVRVVARTSSFSFRDRQTDAMEIGARLGADAVLEGSVRRSGDRLRITAQLIDTVNGYHVWSQTYESVFSDAFAVQDQIARGVSHLLQNGTGEDQSVARSWTTNAAAAEAYYLARFHLQKNKAESVDLALDYFQLAITLDPQFALAYAGLAEAHRDTSEERWGSTTHEEARRNYHEAFRIAQSLDDTLAEVLRYRADEARREGNVEEAETLLLRVIDQNPSNALAYASYGGLLARIGREDEALAARQKAVSLDPLDNGLRYVLAESYYALNKNALARAELFAAIELDPGFHAPYFFLGLLLFENGEVARAIDAGIKGATVEGSKARWARFSAIGVGYGYLTLGDYIAADQWFSNAGEMGMKGWYLANNRLHLLLAQDRYDDADALLTYWERNHSGNARIFTLGGLFRSIMGQDEAAVEMFEQALALQGDGDTSNLFREDFLAFGYVPAVHYARLLIRAGAVDEAEMLLRESEQNIASLQQNSPGWAGSNYVRASIHALRGDDRAAIASLRIAVASGWNKLWFAERDPVFAAYRGSQDFESILADIEDYLVAQRQLLERQEDLETAL